MEASNVVPPIVATESYRNIPQKAAGKVPKDNLLRSVPKEKKGRLQQLFGSLNLNGIESWDEPQKQSVRDLLMEYQHLLQ